MTLPPRIAIGTALLVAGLGMALYRALAPDDPPAPPAPGGAVEQPALPGAAPADERPVRPGSAAANEPFAARPDAGPQTATPPVGVGPPAPAARANAAGTTGAVTQTDPAPVALDELLGVEPARAASGLDAQRLLREDAAARPAPAAGASSALTDKLRLEHRAEPLPKTAPGDAKVSQTDVGVAVPVDAGDSLRLRGGVRVDQTQHGSDGTRDVQSTPTVGIEKRF